ncbi:MAG: hypothetical protein PHV62_03175 [Sulfuricurvum sp.]|nr:hypothetical protein [Sulfuricurvum sp.]
MRKALVTTVDVEINTYIHPVYPDPEGTWEMRLYPANSIINIIKVNEGSDYNPPDNTYLVDAVDSMKIGDIYQG